MARGYTTNMTEGSAAGLLLRFMLPLLAGNIFQQVYSAADMVIVGRFIGADALAAVGATNSLNFLFFSLCNGLAGGLGILVAQAFGANRPDTVKRLIVNGAYLMAAGAAAMGALGFALAGRVLALVNTPENIIGDSVVYMRLMCLGVIAVSLYNGVSAVLRGLGDSRTPLFFLVVSSILNVLLDLVFICAFGWGVGGAAAATILSQLVSALGCIAYALRHNPMFLFDRSSWRWDGTLIGRCCRLGVPLAAQSSMIALSLVALQSVVNGFGSVVGAAFTATSRVEVMAQQPFNSLFAALATFTGQNIGAGRQERVRRGFWQAAGLAMGFAALMTLLFEAFSPQIMGLFVDAGEASEVIAYGARGLRLTGWFLAPLGMIYVTRGILNGAGDSAYSLISGACEMTGRVAFPRPLTRLPAVGAMGIWLGTALTWTLVAAAGLIRYFSGAWRKKAAMQGAGNRE
ncbi:MAG: MATE family efflux transporter [Clostridia bacterium]|nr:MATE family efflux transporter [Clostridia bacterium]